jgi:hypothetical protein
MKVDWKDIDDLTVEDLKDETTLTIVRPDRTVLSLKNIFIYLPTTPNQFDHIRLQITGYPVFVEIIIKMFGGEGEPDEPTSLTFVTWKDMFWVCCIQDKTDDVTLNHLVDLIKELPAK